MLRRNEYGHGNLYGNMIILAIYGILKLREEKTNNSIEKNTEKNEQRLISGIFKEFQWKILKTIQQKQN